MLIFVLMNVNTWSTTSKYLAGAVKISFVVDYKNFAINLHKYY